MLKGLTLGQSLGGLGGGGGGGINVVNKGWSTLVRILVSFHKDTLIRTPNHISL